MTRRTRVLLQLVEGLEDESQVAERAIDAVFRIVHTQVVPDPKNPGKTIPSTEIPCTRRTAQLFFGALMVTAEELIREDREELLELIDSLYTELGRLRERAYDGIEEDEEDCFCDFPELGDTYAHVDNQTLTKDQQRMVETLSSLPRFKQIQ